MEAGATDFLSNNLLKDELHRRLRLVLQQRRQNRALARRNSNLQALTSLARRLHTATDPKSLIADTIAMTCRTFKLYGMVIVMREGDMLHIYAGQDSSTKSTLYDSLVHTHDYDPFRRVIDSGFVQTFLDIKTDSYFTPIPILPKAESTIIVPLAYPEYTYGALAAFGTTSRPLDHEDLIIYELFAAQFTTALQNAQHYEEQERRVLFSSHLLKAWQRFVTLESHYEIVSNLRELVEDLPSVNQALAWLYEDEQSDSIIVNAAQPEVVDIFSDLHTKGLVNKLFEELDEGLQVSLQLGRGQKDPLGPLYRGLRGQQLMLFPIIDAARVAGGVIASPTGNTQFGVEDANLLKSLAHAAGQALVRNTLTEVMGEKGGRLEAILRSIYEGIFFVDNTGSTAFVNTQFAELTTINLSDVLHRPPEVLLDHLAQRSDDPEKVYGQLHKAVNSVLGDDDERENYTILEIKLDPDREINVEFTRIIGTLNNEYLGWIGIVRDNTRLQNMFSKQMSLLDLMSEQIRVPHAELRGLVTTLTEQHTRISGRERARFLRQIDKNIENVGQLWENFLDVYNLEVSGLVLEREESDPYDITQRVLDSRIFNEHRRQIRIEAPARLPMIKVDELRIEKAISNVLQFTLDNSPKGAPVVIKMESRNNELRIVVQDQGPGIPSDKLESIFEPFTHEDDDSGENTSSLGLYLSRELIQRHGGRIWAESTLGKGTMFVIALPSAQSDGVVSMPPRPEIVEMPEVMPRDEQRGSGYSVQKRQPKTIMVVEGKSNLVTVLRNKLKTQGYEMLLYKSGEDALHDVNATRLDLVVLDVNLADANSLDICERMRKRTQVPIIMLADEASVAEELRALKYADSFITKPISEDQLMARVDVILKRVVDLPTRTREPLDLGELYIDFARREVFLHNKPIELTRIEYDLLNTLAINENQVLTHKQLLDKVWGPEYQAETQYLWVNVSRLRKKLEPTPDSPRYIHTQQGVGYVFRRP
jgi:DNA-binding response OmpR family regulator/signal transduction histidine kinase